MTIDADQYQTMSEVVDAQKFVQRCHAHRRNQVEHIRKLFVQGKTKQLRKLRYSYFKNSKVRISALSKAGVQQPSIQHWEREARMFDPFSPSIEVITWWHQPKPSGGHRVVCALPPFLKATHNMIADIIAAQLGDPGPVYNLKGRNRDMLVENLLTKLASGFDHYRVYDIRDCFQSVSPSALQQLKIPKRIINYGLNLDNLHFRERGSNDTPTFTGASSGNSPHMDIVDYGPTGIMQGSPASNLILAYLLQTLPKPEHDAGHEFLFGDDLIVVAKDEATCCGVDQKLTAFLGQPELGPFHLSRKFSGHQGTFEYLGYEFRHNAITASWEIFLSQSNWEKIRRRWVKTLTSHLHKFPLGLTPDINIKPMRSMLNGFPALPNQNAIVEMLVQTGPDELELSKLQERSSNGPRRLQACPGIPPG